MRSRKLPIQTAALPWRLNHRRRPEVLLVTSRRSRNWIVPKGWPMVGKSMADAAAREAFEEAGITGRLDPHPLGSFEHTKRNLFGSLHVKVLVHPLEVERELSNWPESRQRKRKWFLLDEAVAAVESKELGLIIASLDARLTKRDR